MKRHITKISLLLLVVLLLSACISALSVQIHAKESTSVQIIQQPQSQAVHKDKTAIFTVIATGENLQYQWQYRLYLGVWRGYSAWYDSTSVTPGYNTNTLRVSGNSGRNENQYRCVIFGNGESMYSDVVTLTVQEHNFTEDTRVAPTCTEEGSVTFRCDCGDTNVVTLTVQEHNFIEDSSTLVPPTCSENGSVLYYCDCGETVKKILPYLGHSFSNKVCKKCGMTIDIPQPTNRTVRIGGKASFSVKVRDPAATYRWEYQYLAGGGWYQCTSKTPGYNTSRITVEGAAARDGYRYRCKVTFKCESGYSYSVYSDAATLTVHNLLEEHTYDSDAVVVDSTCTKQGSVSNTCICGYTQKQLLPLAPHSYVYGTCSECSAKNPDYSAITEHPQNSFVKQGGRGVFHVAVDVKDPVYRWQYQLRENGPWFSTSSYTTGYNTDTLTVVAEAKRDGFNYRCRITDAYGNKYYSEPAVLDVDTPAQNAFALQPEAKWVMEGGSAVFSVQTQGSVASIQWQYQTAPGKAWYNSTSATQGYNTDSLTVNAEAKRNGFSYRCVITDTDGYIHTSDEVVLTITKAQFDTDPQSVTIEAGENHVFAVNVIGEYTQVYWQYSTNGGESWYASSSSFPGYNTTAMTVEAKTSRDGFMYRCVIIDADGTRIHSQPAMLNVIEEAPDLVVDFDDIYSGQ